MSIDHINVQKANVHNLKSVSIKIPKNTLTVITGPSGSGKSSLAFDTIYVEGQRRYIESLSSYARQFMTQYQPPDVEVITGLSPAIAIDQKTSSKNPRSTVGTITEIYDYLRVLFARVGKVYCPESGEEIKKYTPAQIAKDISKQPANAKIFICTPIAWNDKKELKSKISQFMSQGYVRVVHNNKIINLDSFDIREVYEGHQLDLVIDRLLNKPENNKRLNDSIELGLKLESGMLNVLINDDWHFYSDQFVSPVTKEKLPDIEPRLFSFNSPLGACDNCNGLGVVKTFDLNLMLTDKLLSIVESAIPILNRNNFLYKMVEGVAEEEGVDLYTPYRDLSDEFKEILLYGSSKKYKYSFNSENSHFEFTKSFPGIVNWLDKKYKDTTSERTRKNLEEFINTSKCPVCRGQRLNEIALSTKIKDQNIYEISHLPIRDLYEYLQSLKLNKEQSLIAAKLLNEIRSRTKFLLDVGLGYLTLNRAANTLSGGESQRIRLATQIGSALSGVLYVLDEPSIGLHQRDNTRLIQTLFKLRDLGNTVLVVEHDEETIRSSDYIIDIGPGAGIHGGEIIAKGSPDEILKKKKSTTANYLNGTEVIEVPEKRRKLSESIKLTGAKANNLQTIDVEIPLGGLVLVTGVSGSGKSTLIHEVFVPALKYHTIKANRSLYKRNNYDSLTDFDSIKQIIELDQSPIGRTPKSNPATYTGIFDDIRKLFAKTKESQVRGYQAGRFSFNVKGGRCEHCEGNGSIKVEMHFLPDVYITCPECLGKRYNAETLGVLYKGKNISEILNMDIEEAGEFFANHSKINRTLSVLNEVGLGYMKLGQSATTLSGGEAQRLKLCRELAKSTKGKSLYVLDEPTTGLHFKDIQALLGAINRLIDLGHSVLVIEHNLDVIKTADWIIDLGPEGGDGGGQIVATGTPEEVTKKKKSHTGKYLKPYL